MVDDGIYYFSSYRAERDVMSWENTIKAPPPRPSDKDIPQKSRYFSPRWLKATHKETDVSIDTKFATYKPVTVIDISPIHSNFDAFIVDAKTFRRFEDLSSLSIEEDRDLQRDLEADIGQGKLKFLREKTSNVMGYLASDVDKVYEQMMDDIYDDFEVWNAYGGWKMFEKKYHSKPYPTIKPRFGGEIYVLSDDVNEWLTKAETLLNSKYPAMNARIRTTVTNLVNGLKQAERKPITYVNI